MDGLGLKRPIAAAADDEGNGSGRPTSKADLQAVSEGRGEERSPAETAERDGGEASGCASADKAQVEQGGPRVEVGKEGEAVGGNGRAAASDGLAGALSEDDARASKSLGARGEDAAARFLGKKGYRILDRNWRCPAGEADIIAMDGEVLVFVEVKTRTGIETGMPDEAVDARKRGRYERIAAYYLRDFDSVDMPIRFDVIGILVVSDDRALLKHHINAFAVAS